MPVGQFAIVVLDAGTWRLDWFRGPGLARSLKSSLCPQRGHRRSQSPWNAMRCSSVRIRQPLCWATLDDDKRSLRQTIAHWDERLRPRVLHRHGTPDGLRVLAFGLLDQGWQERAPRAGQPARSGVHAATMGESSRNGFVFTAATTDWAQVLASGQDGRVESITRNVMERLMQA